MDLDDVLDPEVGITAGVLAVAFSPRVRGVVRKGAVMGLAGVLTAGDAMIGVARGAAHEARGAVQEARERQSANGGSAAEAASRQRQQPAATG